MSRGNVEIVRRAYEVFNRGDLDAAVAVAAPDAEYVATGAIPGVAGVYRGPEGLKRFVSWLRGVGCQLALLIESVLNSKGDSKMVGRR